MIAESSRLERATGAPIAGHTDFPGHVVGVDVEVPLAGRFVARGEAWTGRTAYVGLPDGTDNRVNAYAIYGF